MRTAELLSPKATGTWWEGEEKEEKEASLSTLKISGTERFTNLPKATQQDLNQGCLAGQPAFVQNTTYCRLIKVVIPAGPLTVPPPA